MDVLFRGRLTYEVRLSHVLEHVRELKTKGVTLLFVRSPDQAIEGVVSIWNSRFITSARLYRSILSGYPALKQLFTLATGDFAYGKPENEEVNGIEHELNIELKSIIPVLPFLPENLTELFDQNSLLDNVFAPQVEPAKPSEMKPPTMSSPPAVQEDGRVWQFFRNLLGGGTKTDKKRPRTKIDRRAEARDRQSDPRATLRLKRQSKHTGPLGLLLNFLRFWTRTEILVVATALITAVGLLWLCEKVAPHVETHFKALKPFHMKLKLQGKGYSL